ncbi:SufS family cysteine desulfurase [Candidatus Dojkabacteria bacterium]|nr:SufS family cysteine desulfurase [Candidatus Dojkabacteria bacterium]
MNLKSKFPIFETYPNLVYLDSAATTQKPDEVIKRIVKYYNEENSNVHRGIYKLSEKATAEYENARATVAQFINAKSAEEIIFTSGTTDSINFVSHCWNNENGLGEYIITTQMEHHSNFIPWQQRVKFKSQNPLMLVDVDIELRLNLEDLKVKLEKYIPKLLTLTHVSNVTGVINPIKQIVELKNKISPKTRILIDCAQSIAHIPVDVQDLGVDFIVFSGHKMYAATGTGILWAKSEVLENELQPYRYGGGMIQDVEIEDSTWAEIPGKFEGGTPNIEGAISIAEAVKFIKNIGFEEINKHEAELCNYALTKLSKLSEITIIGPKTIEERTGVISISLDGVHPHDVAQILDEDNIAVRAGHHCNQILMKYVLKIPATTRISFGVYNDKEDIDRLIEGLEKVIKIFK